VYYLETADSAAHLFYMGQIRQNTFAEQALEVKAFVVLLTFLIYKCLHWQSQDDYL
jgi:hypothetical protein